MRLESSSLPIRTANTDTLRDEIDWAIRQYEIGFEPGKLRRSSCSHGPMYALRKHSVPQRTSLEMAVEADELA